jgi:putative oxidoreductase
MVVASSANLKNGFFAQKGGYEYTLVLGIAALSLAFTGAGALSADAALGLDLGDPTWGLAAGAVGALGAALQLASRRKPAGEAPLVVSATDS